MAKIKLVFDVDRVTIDDLVYLEEGVELATAVELREFLTKFVVDEAGKTPTQKKAVTLVGKMTIGEVVGAIGKLGDMAKDEIVPPSQGGS